MNKIDKVRLAFGVAVTLNTAVLGIGTYKLWEEVEELERLVEDLKRKGVLVPRNSAPDSRLSPIPSQPSNLENNPLGYNRKDAYHAKRADKRYTLSHLPLGR